MGGPHPTWDSDSADFWQDLGLLFWKSPHAVLKGTATEKQCPDPSPSNPEKVVAVDCTLLPEPVHSSSPRHCLRFLLSKHTRSSYSLPLLCTPMTTKHSQFMWTKAGAPERCHLSRASSSTLAGSWAARFRLRIRGVAWRGVLVSGCIRKREHLDNQQGPTVEQRELYSMFCNNLNGKRIWKRMDICICITESLCCTPETNTTL